MNNQFNKGLILASFGSFWWGFFGVLYFKYISFIVPLELVIHRCLWTVLTLVVTTFYFSKWDLFFKTIKIIPINKKKNRIQYVDFSFKGVFEIVIDLYTKANIPDNKIKIEGIIIFNE